MAQHRRRAALLLEEGACPLAERLPGAPDPLGVEAELGGAAAHLDRALEHRAGAHERVHDAAGTQRVALTGEQGLEVGGARLGQAHVEDDAHPPIVPSQRTGGTGASLGS